MVEAEPAIQQLLKLDFEPKVSATIRTFRQTINQTQNSCVASCWTIGRYILQQYNHARAYLTKLEQEAEDKINNRTQSTVDQKIEAYNQVVSGINSYRRCSCMSIVPVLALPEGISDSNFVPVSPEPEAFKFSPDGVGVSDSNSRRLELEVWNKDIRAMFIIATIQSVSFESDIAQPKLLRFTK